PKGFFETAEINGINEYLLAGALPAHPPLERMQRWLAAAPLDLEFDLPAALGRRIGRLAERRPFAFKDPRFCYTLPAWRPLLGEFGVVCVFREPAVTAASILKECGQEAYLASLEMDFERAVGTWVSMYRQVLERHRREGDWLFVHYDQLLTEEGLTRLEDFVGGRVGRDFPDPSLRRSQSQEPVSPEAAALYDELCRLAGHDHGSVPVLQPPETALAQVAEPELTVLICTYQRRETLVRCLDSFCAQTSPHGSFELVVVNDGSTDGTAEYLDEREFDVPVQIVHRENGGLSAARNSGLEVARGRIVLLVNDDTIATPGLVAAHLAAHRKLRARKVAVLGTFEQPPAALDNALMRTLEETDLVFCYADMQPGTLHDWNRFWTCNVSVPTEAVREVGAFDEEFRYYGCEDTDLALRLDAAGYEVYYEERARAYHDHILEFEDLARRNRTVARAWVRLFQKHPRALEHEAWSWVTAQGLGEYERLLVGALPDMPAMQSAARELSRIDLGALERLGVEGRAWARDVRANLEKLLRVLNRLWWFEGLAEGLREFDLDSFQPLLESLAPWPLGTEAPLRVLAWPRYDRDDDLRHLAETYADSLLATEGVCLCLRHDPERDGPLEEAVTRVEAALGTVVREGRVLDVLLVDDALNPDDLTRLGQAVTCVLDVTGGDDPERVEFLRALNAVAVDDADGLQRALTGDPSTSRKLAAAS
ncbi:MAG: glycosyltransferase, partial [Planctomycetota bacterium]